MKKQLTWVMLMSLLVLPYARAWAEEESKESARNERMETIEVKQHEEREAMERYQKAVAKHGADSAQAKKAWKHVIAEYKEHGDTPPVRPAAASETK